MGTPQEAQDPLQEGQPSWQERTRELARHWAGGLSLEYEGVSIPKAVEYTVMDMLNREFDASERPHD